MKEKLELEDSRICSEVNYKEVRPSLCAIFSLKALFNYQQNRDSDQEAEKSEASENQTRMFNNHAMLER